MSVLPFILIFIGCLLLAFSLKPAYSICQQNGYIGWKFLFALITLFLFCYLFFLFHLVTHPHSPANFIEDTLTIILFGGSV